jgi:NTE family protein
MQKQHNSDRQIGLALSGGGYRAAAFHLGTMRKLNQLGLLDKVDVLSTVSGGSIIGADYLLQLDENRDYHFFEANHIKKLKQSVIGSVLRSVPFISILGGVVGWFGLIIYLQFTSFYGISIPILFAGIWLIVSKQFLIFPVSKIIETIYNRIFYQGKTLSNLPDRPIVAINSTNLETGRQFTFSKLRMGDSTYDYPAEGDPIRFIPDAFPVAKSVMASSCVPFAFTPVEVGREYFQDSSYADKVKPMLVDGGVFDNQGVHKLTHEKSGYECKTVIVSDAGNKMPFENSQGNVIALLIRVCDLFMNRIKKFEMTDNIYHNVVLRKKELAYISLGWDLEACISGFVTNLRKELVLPEVIASHDIPSEYFSPFDEGKIKKHLEEKTGYNNIPKMTEIEKNTARSVGTNLTALPDDQINALIKHAETMTELQVKLYCPSILKSIVSEK